MEKSNITAQALSMTGHRSWLPLFLTIAAVVALSLPFYTRIEGHIDNLLVQIALELGAILCALAAAAVGFARYVALRKRLSFFLGLSYLTAGFADLLHLCLLYGPTAVMPAERTTAAMGSWLASRTALAFFLLVGILLSQWFPRDLPPRRIALLMTSTAATVIGAVFYLFIHFSLPNGLTFIPLPRPWELLPAALFVMAFYAYLRKAQEKDAPPYWGWVVLSITLGFFTQIYMAQSVDPHDVHSTIAHLLKVMSYLLPVIGLYVDSIYLVRRHVSLTQELSTLNDVIEAERNQLRTIIDLLPVGVFITHSPGGEGSLINRKGIDLLGASILHDTGALGYSPTYNLCRSEGQPYPPEELPLHRALATGEQAEAQDVVLYHPDGREILLWIQAMPIKDKMGHVTGAISVYYDVTEKDRYERQLKHYNEMLERANDELDAILQSMAAGVFTVNAEGGITTLNSAAEEILGVMRQEAIGRHYTEVLGTDCVCQGQCRCGSGEQQHSRSVSQQAPLDALRETLQTGERCDNWERIIRRSDGRLLILSVSTASLRRQDEVVGAVAIFHDVTLLKEAEKAQATLRAQNQFLSTMSHELRTPLNSILALSQLLLDQNEAQPNRRECLEVIHRNGQHLLRLINDLMDLTKIEAGKVDVNLSEFSLEEVLDWLLASVAPLAEKKGLTIQRVVPDNLPSLYTDEKKVNQILFNLLSNAIKFTESGGKIEVRATACRRPGMGEGKNEERGEASHSVPFLAISVTDTGIGIPADQIPLVFERFRQLDEGMARQYDGAGLGLTICKGLVELLGGQIECESAVGVGSTFTFVIPVRYPHTASSLSADVEPESAPASVKPDVPLKKVLIVEDDPDQILIIQHILGSMPWDVVVAEDGEQAILAAEREHPDLILMDLHLPRLSGYEVTMRIKEQPSLHHTPIIALTAATMSGTRERTLAVGCDDYLSKPYKPGELVSIVKKYLSLT